MIIAEYPDSVWEAKARALKGLYRKFRSEWDEAEVEFSRVLELDPPERLRHDIATSQACILVSRGQYDSAITMLEDIRQETTDWDQKKYLDSWLHNIKQRQVLRQFSHLNSCGAESLAYMLEQMGRGVQDEEVDSALSPEDRSSQLSLSTLHDAAVRLGMNLTGVKMGLEEVTSSVTPLLALVKPGHYIVVKTRRDDGHIVVYDPERGKAAYTEEVLGRKWTGYALIAEEKIVPSRVTLATREEMDSLVGSVCPCCPQTIVSTRPGQEESDPGGEGGGGGDGDGGGSCGPGTPNLKVNWVNLNLIVEDIDMKYSPRLGPPIEFKRRYNNRSASSSAFGKGWTHSYNLSIEAFPTEAHVTRGDGRIDIFDYAGDGAFNPPLGVNDTLILDEDGYNDDDGYYLDVHQEKLVYYFSLDGRLEKIIDYNGNPVSLGYAEDNLVIIGESGGGSVYLENPSGVDVDSLGNIFVADTDNHRIVKFDSSGNFLLQWGVYGSNPGEFKIPLDVTVDYLDNVYVVEHDTRRVQKFTSDGQFLTTWGSVGSGQGQFNFPYGIDTDESGNVYVADTYNHRIQKFDSDGVFLLEWGSMGSGDGQFVYPKGVSAGGGVVYVTDNHNRVQKFDTDGLFLLSFGSYGTGDGQFSEPADVTTDVLGNIFVADTNNDRVQKFDSLEAFLLMWGAFGSDDSYFDAPMGVSVDDASSSVVVADTTNDRIQIFDSAGTFLSKIDRVRAGEGEFTAPEAIVIDSSGNIYVSDRSANRIQKFDSSWNYILDWGRYGFGDGEFSMARGMAFDASGVLHIADSGNHRIQKFSQDGVYLGEWPVYGGGSPVGIIFTSDGVQDVFYVVDNVHHELHKYAADGTFILKWGSYGTGDMQFKYPMYATTDAANNLYVSDSTCVRKFTPGGVYVGRWATTTNGIHYAADGYIYTATFWGPRRFTTDGTLIAEWGTNGAGPGEFASPAGIVMDSGGHLIVADTMNQRLQVIDARYPLGNVLRFITDASGEATEIQYNDNLLASTLIAPDSSVAHFEYQGGFLVRSIDMEGVSSTFSYNQDGYISSMVKDESILVGGLPASFDITYLVTPGVPQTITNPHGKVYQINWPMGAPRNDVTDPLGHVTKYYYNDKFYTSSIVNHLNESVQYTYNPDTGDRVGVTDAENHTTSWEVDEKGRMTSYMDGLGNQTTWVYDDVLYRETRTDPAPFSYQTLHQKDAYENILSITDPEGHVTSMTYYSDGRMASLTPPGPGNRTTTWQYNDAARTTTITDPLGGQTVLTYDAMGRLIGREDPLQNLTEYGYNDLGRLEMTRFPALKYAGEGSPRAVERHIDYNCCRTRQVTDELGRTTSYEHDEVNRLIAVRNDVGGLIQGFGYYDDGTRMWMSDALGRTTDYAYDELKRLTTTTYPDDSTEAFTYYKDHRLKTRTDRMSRTTTFTYDAAGRLLSKLYPDQSEVVHTYDELGRMTSATYGQTSLAYTYTPTGRADTVTMTQFGIQKILSFEYYDDGSLWKRHEPGGHTVTYMYDEAGRLASLTDGDGEIFTFEYSSDGRMTRKNYPSGAFTEYEFNSRGWPTVIRHEKGQGPAFEEILYASGDESYYGPVGNRTARVDDDGSHLYSYDYDGVDRVVGAVDPVYPLESYSYDAVGNRLTSADYSDWTYDAAGMDQLASFDGLSYTYGGNGSRATKTDPSGTTTYTYDYENRLTRVDFPGGYAEYAYDALGRRVRKDVSGAVTLYWYDGDNQVLETDGAGVETARYTVPSRNPIPVDPISIPRIIPDREWFVPGKGEWDKMCKCCGSGCVRRFSFPAAA